jgi:hypothetical protein
VRLRTFVFEQKGPTLAGHHYRSRRVTTLSTGASGVQAAVLGGSQVRLIPVDEFADTSFDSEGTLVLFPSEKAIGVEELDASTVKDVVIIDTRWYVAVDVHAWFRWRASHRDLGWSLWHRSSMYMDGSSSHTQTCVSWWLMFARKKANEVLRSTCLSKFRCIKLQNNHSAFWSVLFICKHRHALQFPHAVLCVRFLTVLCAAQALSHKGGLH